MDSALLVPATAALLDDWQGPAEVELLDEHTATTYRRPAIAITPTEDGVALLVEDWDGDHEVVELPMECVWLDLSRAECRDRVARVLALGGTEVAWRRGWRDARPSWILSWRPVPSRRAAGIVEQAHCPPDLDWMDDTRLPDGSRLVDALALAAVAREVLRCAP